MAEPKPDRAQLARETLAHLRGLVDVLPVGLKPPDQLMLLMALWTAIRAIEECLKQESPDSLPQPGEPG